MLGLVLTLSISAAPPQQTPAAPPPERQSLPQGSAALPSVEQVRKLQEQVYRDIASHGRDDAGVRERLLQGDLSDAISYFMTGDGGMAVPRYTWKVPDLQYYIDVPGMQVVNGMPVRFSAAVSSARPSFLIKYYIDEFEKAGLYLPPPEHQFEPSPPVIQVTALDTDSLTSYTAMIQVIDDKHTTVIMSQGYLQPWLRKKRGPGTEADFAPLFPHAEHVVRSRTEGMDLIEFSTTSEPTAVRGFYHDVMTKAGYQEQTQGTFVRGLESIRVNVVRTEGRKETGVLVQRRMLPKEPEAGP